MLFGAGTTRGTAADHAVDRNTQEGRAAVIRVRRQGRGEGQRVGRIAGAYHRQGQFIARFGGLDLVDKIVRVRYRFPIDLGDHIFHFHAGLVSRAAGRHLLTIRPATAVRQQAPERQVGQSLPIGRYRPIGRKWHHLVLDPQVSLARAVRVIAQRHLHGRRGGLALALQDVSVALAPGLSVPSTLARSLLASTVWSLTFVITSPALTPALSAGPPEVTWITQAPVVPAGGFCPPKGKSGPRSGKCRADPQVRSAVLIAQRDIDAARFVAMQNFEGQFIARFKVLQQALLSSAVGLVDGYPVRFQNDIAPHDPGFIRRAAGCHRPYQ